MHEPDDRRAEADAVNRQAGRAGAFALPGSGFQPDRRRVFGPVLLYLVPVFCLLTAVTSRALPPAVLGLELLVGLLLLQNRWGLRRRTPGLNSDQKPVA